MAEWEIGDRVETTCDVGVKRIHAGDRGTITHIGRTRRNLDDHLTDYVCVTWDGLKYRDGGWWVGEGFGLNTTMLRNLSTGMSDTREYLELVSQKSDESYVS